MIPRRPLIAIACAVVALHATVLGLVALPAVPSQAAVPRVFHTRTLPAPAPAAAMVAPAITPTPPSTPTAAPAPKPKIQRPARPKAPAAAATLSVPSLPPAPSTAAERLAEPAPGEAPAPGDAPITEPSAGPTTGPTTEPATTVADATAHAPVAQAPASAAEPLAPPPPPGIAIAAPGGAEDGAPAHSAPVRLPDPMRLDFAVQGVVKGFPYSASAELLWQHDGRRYQARQEISALFLGSRAQTSVGEITALGLQPRRFGDKSRSEKAAHFDFAKGQVTFSSNAPSAAIAPGAQDRLSVFLQLGAMLAAAPQSYPAGTRIRIPTVSARAADLWTFTIEGAQTLDLPLGSTPTLLLERLPRRDYDLKAQVWLAPALGYLPARIRITQANGDTVELNLRAHAPL